MLLCPVVSAERCATRPWDLSEPTSSSRRRGVQVSQHLDLATPGGRGGLLGVR